MNWWAKNSEGCSRGARLAVIGMMPLFANVTGCGGSNPDAKTEGPSAAARHVSIYVVHPDDPKANPFRDLLNEHFGKLGYSVAESLTDADVDVSMSFTVQPHKEGFHLGPPHPMVDIHVALLAEGDGEEIGKATGDFVFGQTPPPEDVDALCSSTLSGPRFEAFASRLATAPGALGSVLPLPSELAECDGDECTKGNPGTWIFHGTTGVSHQPHGAVADLVIKRFDPDDIVIRRVDRANSAIAGLTAVYTGKMRDGRISGAFIATWPGHIQSMKGTWFATVPVTNCDGLSEPGAQDYIETAGMALRFQHLPEALKCFLGAANLGNAQGRVVAGIMYRDGIGTAAEPAKALELIKQSAVEGEYNAQVALAQMYETGVGTAADPDQAKLWKERAMENPSYVAVQKAAEQQKANQQMMFMGLAALAEAFAAPRVYVAGSLL